MQGSSRCAAWVRCWPRAPPRRENRRGEALPHLDGRVCLSCARIWRFEHVWVHESLGTHHNRPTVRGSRGPRYGSDWRTTHTPSENTRAERRPPQAQSYTHICSHGGIRIRNAWMLRSRNWVSNDALSLSMNRKMSLGSSPACPKKDSSFIPFGADSFPPTPNQAFASCVPNRRPLRESRLVLTVRKNVFIDVLRRTAPLGLLPARAPSVVSHPLRRLSPPLLASRAHSIIDRLPLGCLFFM